MKFKKLTSAVLLGLLVNQPVGYSAPVINSNDPNSGLVDNTSVVNSTFINQQTQNLSLHWNSFNINSNETVQFIQPSSTSIAFNHINSLDPSIIAGQLNANGQIVLINPNGLIFSEGATLNVGGIVASGLNINSEQFLNGSTFLNHDQNTNGYVINNGVINASTGGSVTLVGTEVVNNGVITASLGKVNLAAGDSGILTFDTQGMFGIEITSSTVKSILGNDSAVINNGSISAQGGQVLLTAEVSRDVFTNAVNNQGIVSANSIEMHDGFIRITSSTGDVQQDGNLDASSVVNSIAGGRVEIYAENINNTGVINADGLNADGGKIHLESNNTSMISGDSLLSAQAINNGQTVPTIMGGEINILGENVGLVDNTVINTSGFNGGGEIHIGGGFQGNDESLRNASRTYLGQYVNLHANANNSGNGGEVIVWSDIATYFFGSIEATGGLSSGDGGFSEVSGKLNLLFEPNAIELSSANGTNGMLLLDPYDLKIENSGGQSPSTEATDPEDGYTSAGSNPTIFTLAQIFAGEDSGSYKIEASSITDILDDNNNVVLFAAHNLSIKDEVSSSGTGDLTLNAGNDIKVEDNVNIGGDLILNANNSIELKTSALTAGGSIFLNADYDNSGNGYGDGFIIVKNDIALTATQVNFSDYLFSEEFEYNDLIVNGSATFNNIVGAGSVGGVEFDLGKLIVTNVATINTANIYTSKEQSYGSIVIGDNVTTELSSDGAQGDSSISAGAISGNSSMLGSITLYTNPDDSLGTITITGIDDVAISDINNFTISDSKGVSITGSTSLNGNFEVTNTTGAVTLNGSLIANQLITAATSNYSLAFNHGGTINDSNATTLNNTLGVTFGNEATDNFIFTNGLTSIASTTNLFGKLSSVDSLIQLADLNVTTQGEINTGSGSGNIQISGTVDSSSAILSLNAGAGNISATNSSNDFSNLILISHDADIVDTDGLVLGHGSVSGGVNLSGDLDLTVGGALTNLDNVIVAGSTKLTAGTNNITINGSSNNLNSLSIVSANDVTITDTDGLEFGHATDGGINVAGFLNVTLTGTGNLTDEDTNAIGTDVVGTTTLNVGSNTIDLQNTSNDFSAVLLTATAATILDSNAIDLGTSTIGTGGLNITTTAGNITDSGKLDITGNSAFAVNTAGSDIILDSTDNIFTGTVTITNANLNNVTLYDTTALDLQALTTTGNLTVTAEGITQSGNLLITGEAFFDGDGNGDTTGANVDVGTATNNFTEVAVANGANVTIGDVDSVALGAITASGTLDVTSTGITTGSGSNAGAVDITGVTTLNVTAAGNIDLTNSSNDFSNIILTANNATLVDANALVLGITGAGNDVDISGDLDITVAAQAAGTLTNENTVTVAGNTKFTAGTNNVTINGFSDDLASLSIVSAGTVTIEEINALVLGDVTNGGVNVGELNITLTSATGTDHLTDVDSVGAQTIVTGSTTIDVGTNNVELNNALNDFSTVAVTNATTATLVDENTIDLGAINVTDLIVTSIAGNITDSAALSISDTSSFTLNGTGVDLLLDTSTNSFGGVISITMGGTLKDVVIYDTTDLQLPAITTTGILTVDSEGVNGITQSGALIIGGEATLTATNTIDLQNTSNNFSTVLLTATTATILDSNAIDLGASTIGTGGLNITTTAGNITDSGKLDITGNSTFAVNTAGSNIILDSTDNIFTGTVTITNANLNNVTLHDTTVLDLQALTTAGNLNVTAEGITQSGNLLITGEAFFDGDGNGDSTGANVDVGTTTNNFTEVAVDNGVNVTIGDVDSVALGSITASGTLDVTSTNGSITTGIGTNAGAVVVMGVTTLDVGTTGNIDLSNTSNDFSNIVLTANNATLIDANALVLGITGAGNDVDINGDLDITVAAQSAGTLTNENTVTVAGNTKITAGINNVTINGFSDDLASLSIVSAGTVTIEDINALVLGDTTNGGVNVGELNITLTSATGTDHLTDVDSAGAQTIVTGSTAIDVGTNNVELNNALNDFSTVAVTNATTATLVDANTIDLGAINVTDLIVTSIAGNITDSAALSISDTSSFTLNGTNVDLLLDTSTNSFGGVISITMGGTLKDVVIYDTTDLQLPAITTTGILTVDSEGVNGITQSGALIIGGDATLTATNTIDLQNTSNNFSTVLLTATTATILDSNAIDLGASSIGAGGLNITTTAGNITDSGQLNITGNSTFAVNTAGSDIILDSTDNIFTGTVTITNANLNNVTLYDTTTLDLQELTTAGNLNVTAEGITQSGNLIVTGEAYFNGDGNGDTTGANVDVGTTTNNFTEVAVDNAVNVTIGDVDSVALGAITASGTFEVTSTGITTGIGSNAGAVDVTGVTTLSAVGGDIVLTDVANDFNNISILSANLIEIVDVNLLTINSITNIGAITFSADEIDLSAAIFSGATTLTLNGNGALSTLTGTTQDLTWNISDLVPDSGTINNIAGVTATTFNDFGNLIGSGGDDTFNLSLVSDLSGSITGGGEATATGDRVIYSTPGQTIILDSNSYLQIENIQASGLGNILEDQLGITTFTIDGGNTGTINSGMRFTGFQTINAGNGDDIFDIDFLANGITLNGGAGDDTILTNLIDNIPSFTDDVAGNGALSDGSNTLTFSSVQIYTDDGTGTGTYTINGTTAATTYTLDLDGSVSFGSLSFTNVDVLNAGAGDFADTFTINGNFGGEVNGLGGVDTFEINTADLTGTTLNGGGAEADALSAIQTSSVTNTWGISSDTSGTINGATFNNINLLNGSSDVDVSDVLTNTIAASIWTIDTSNSTVGAYTFNNINELIGSGTDSLVVNVSNTTTTWNVDAAPVVQIYNTDLIPALLFQYDFSGMSVLTGGNLVDTFNIEVVTNGMTINGQLDNDILNVDLILGSLSITDAVNGNGGFTLGANTLSYNSIEVFGDLGISAGDLIISGPSTATLYTLNVNGSVSFDSLTITNVDILNAGIGNFGDTFLLNGDFSGEVNGLGGADVFQINTNDLTNTTLNGGAGANEIIAIQTTTNTNTWAIDSGTSGSINGGTFNNVTLLNGSSDVDVTDNLTSNIVGNTWVVNASNSSVDAYTFNNMNSLTGGTGVDDFTFNVNFGGTVNALGGADIFQINTNDLTNTTLNGGIGINELLAIQTTTNTNNWVITSATSGSINGGTFNNVTLLNGSSDVDVTDNLTSNIVGNTWVVNASNSSVDAYTFNNMNSLTGGTGVDDFTFNVNFGGTVNALGGADIFQINTNDLTNTTLNGGIGINELLAIQTTTNTNNWVITSATSGSINGGTFNNVTLLNGSSDVDVTDNLTSNIVGNTWVVNASNSSVDAYTFNNMNSLTGGTGVDDFTFNVNFGGTVNALGGADIFQINTNDLTNTTLNGGIGINELLAIQTTTNTNNWVITSATSGSINGGMFNNVTLLNGSSDVDVTDNLTSNIVGNTWVVNASDSSVDAYTFNNMNSLTGGSGVDDFTLNFVVNGDVSGGNGADIFNINVNSAANAINGNDDDDVFNIADGIVGNVIHGNADSINGDNVIAVAGINTWSITTSDSGAIDNNNFDGIEVLTGNGNDTLMVNVSTSGGAIDTNANWIIDSNQTVTITEDVTNDLIDQYEFSGMQILTGGDLVDTFNINIVVNNMTIKGGGADDIFGANLVDGDLTISQATLGNGSFALAGNTVAFESIRIFNDLGIGTGDFSIDGPALGTTYTLSNNGSVSFGNLSFSGVDILNAGDNGDIFEINGDFVGTVNGMDGLDVFQINTPALSSATQFYAHDSLTVSNDIDRIEGVYVGQTGTVNYDWQINASTWVANDSASGTINGAEFYDISMLSGSVDSNIIDTLTSNIATNTWAVNAIINTVDVYTFNNMENLVGGSLVDTFIFDASISGEVNGSGGDDVFNINVSNAASSFNGDAGLDTFNVSFSDQSINIDGGADIDTIKFNGLSVDSSAATLNTNNVTFTHNDSISGDAQVTVVTTVEKVEDYTASAVSSLIGSSNSDTFGLFNEIGFNLAVNVTPELNIYYDVINNLSIDMRDGTDFVNIDSDISFNGVLDITSESIASTNDSILLASAIIFNGFDTVGAIGNGLNIGSVVTDGTLQLSIDNSSVIQPTNVFIDIIDNTNLVNVSIVEDLNISTIASITASGIVDVAGSININGNSSVNIDLNNAANDFSSISLNNLGSVSLINTNPILLSNVSVNNLTIDTVGDISSIADISVAGNLSLDTSNNISDISLTSNGNAISSLDIVQANNATVSNSTALVLGDINLSGDLLLTLDGALTQSGVINAATLNVNLTGVYDVDLMNSNDFDNLVVVNAGVLSINDIGGLSIGVIDATSASIQTTGSINQTASWSIDNGLSITMNLGDSLILTDVGNVVNGNVTFNTTVQDGFFNNLSFYNDGDIVLGSVNVTNALDIKSNGDLSVIGDINIGLNGSASFDTDLDNSGDLFSVSLNGDNSLSNLIVTNASSLDVNNRDSLTIENINISGDLNLQINPDNTVASYTLDNSGNIFVGGDTFITMSDNDVINIGNSSSINLVGDTSFNAQTGTLSSLNFTSSNTLNLGSSSLITENALNINSDLILASDALLQSNISNVTHVGNIDGFVNLTVNAIQGNIEFTNSMIGMATALDTVNMTAEIINAGKINAINGITLVSSSGDITFDQLFSESTIDLTSAANITSSTFGTTLDFADIAADKLITNSVNSVSGLNGDLQTTVNEYTGVITGSGSLQINNNGTIELSGIDVLNGDISITASGSINQTGDIVIQQDTHNLTLIAGDEITMFEPAVSIINHGSIEYKANNTITISELTIPRGDGVITDSILIESNLGDIATTNNIISLDYPDVTANVVTFVALNGSLGVGVQQFVIDANKLVTIATAFSNQPLYVVTPENGVNDSSTVISPTDTSSLLGGDQRTQFSELSTVDPTIFTEVRNFEEDETAILLPEDQLYSAKL